MPAEPPILPDIDCDVLIVGSGAAGLSAAVTAAWHGLKVIVVVKDAVFGGATAWSGGWAWVPCNPLARRAGIVEDVALPRTYLKHELGEHFEPAMIDAFLEAGPQMVAFFEQHTSLQFADGNAIADIHGDTPGAGTGGRSVIAAPMTHETSASCSSVCAKPCVKRRSWACQSWRARTLRHSST